MNGRRYMQGPQGGGGYNPYSKYPDISGLVEQFMQNMMMKKQMEQQRGQQEWQRGMREKEFGLKKRQVEQELTQQPQLSQWQERIQYAAGLVKENKMKPEEFDKFFTTGQWPTGLTPYQEIQIARGKKKDFQGMLEDSVKQFDTEIKRMEMPLSTTQLITAASTGSWPEMDVNEDAIENMKIGRDEVSRLLTLSHKRNLTNEEKALVGKIVSQRGRIAKEGPFWDRGAIQDIKKKKEEEGIKARVEGNVVVYNNKRYPLNVDGTVTIEGKKYKINR